MSGSMWRIRMDGWIDWSTPGWVTRENVGDTIELEYPDGSVVIGVLEVDEWWWDEEKCNDIETYTVLDKDGKEHPFSMHKRFRIVKD
jgi:hypothetical protein